MATDKSPGRTKLIAIVGTVCCVVLISYVPQFEGVVLRGYKDPVGIVTACAGHTATAVLGRPYTPAECEKLLVEDLIDHAAGVRRCVDTPLTTGQLAAAVSFTYNVGVTAFCTSTFAVKLRAGDPKACEQLDRWIYAGGRVLPGLVTRRAAERAICEGKIV